MECFDEPYNVWKNGLLEDLLFLDDCFLHFFLFDVLLRETFYGEQICTKL